jgi:CO/xanthine dehydrogenase Mo-binding subunit
MRGAWSAPRLAASSEKTAFNECIQVPLAKDKVRSVGEPIALVVAESRYVAEDALDDIDVDYDILPANVIMEKAIEPDAPLIHEDAGTNVAAHVIQEKGDVNGAFAKAALKLKRRFYYDHGSAAPMETRGMVASWDRFNNSLMVWDTTQAPIVIRNMLADRLGLSEHQVRVVAPFIGGGFGPKIMMMYPEEITIPWVAMQLGRPVKWIEDRRENFIAMNHERDQIHDAEIALARWASSAYRFIPLRHRRASCGLTVALSAQCTLLGPMRHPELLFRVQSCLHEQDNRQPLSRQGRQHGVFVIERLLDFAPRARNRSCEIRRRNFIPPDKFPYNNEIIYQDFAPLRYDSGNYAAVLDRQGDDRLRQVLERRAAALAQRGQAGRDWHRLLR